MHINGIVAAADSGIDKQLCQNVDAAAPFTYRLTTEAHGYLATYIRISIRNICSAVHFNVDSMHAGTSLLESG